MTGLAKNTKTMDFLKKNWLYFVIIAGISGILVAYLDGELAPKLQVELHFDGQEFTDPDGNVWPITPKKKRVLG
ncbi:MAG: hypothetical protein ACK53X_07765, partial [Holosporales bacterium]